MKIDNVVVYSDGPAEGAQIIELFKQLGVDTVVFMGAVTDCYYGVIDGFFGWYFESDIPKSVSKFKNVQDFEKSDWFGLKKETPNPRVVDPYSWPDETEIAHRIMDLSKGDPAKVGQILHQIIVCLKREHLTEIEKLQEKTKFLEASLSALGSITISD